MTDVRDRVQIDAERRTYHWFVKGLDEVDAAIRRTRDLDRAVGGVLEAAVSIFACDQAWLIYPCDPDAVSWQVPEERRRPGFHGGFDADGDPGLDLVKVDRGQFEQAIVNLAVNARDAMPQGGHLVIETHNIVLDAEYAARHADVRAGRYVLVSVRDSGQGMDPDTIARIFEPFFTTKPPGKGTGLGLAMVYGFVKQSGGHIEVHSEPGEGTTFELYVPSTRQTPRSSRHPSDAGGVRGGSETVLLVEDEDAVRNLSKIVLESKGYTVLEARNGREALESAERHAASIEILVTDLVMPRMGGRELASMLRTERPGLRIVFMSGYADEAALPCGFEANTAFLHKPFSPTSLAKKVREVLDAEE